MSILSIPAFSAGKPFTTSTINAPLEAQASARVLIFQIEKA
ncbi:hypothetical protein [Cupriavidus basilensis]|nr:hypothetical protein [Cupriavidus basilensis]